MSYWSGDYYTWAPRKTVGQIVEQPSACGADKDAQK